MSHPNLLSTFDLKALIKTTRTIILVPNERMALFVEIVCAEAHVGCASMRWLNARAAINAFRNTTDNTVLLMRSDAVPPDADLRADALVWVGDVPHPTSPDFPHYSITCSRVMPFTVHKDIKLSQVPRYTFMP